MMMTATALRNRNATRIKMTAFTRPLQSVVCSILSHIHNLLLEEIEIGPDDGKLCQNYSCSSCKFNVISY